MNSFTHRIFMTIVSCILLSCKNDNVVTPPGPPPPPPVQTSAQITFQTTTPQNNPVLWRISADSGSTPENLTVRLDSLSRYPGNHSNSQGWPGLTIARADLQTVETIIASGQTIHGEGGQATAGAAAVVYTDDGGPHQRDLFIVQRQGSNWSTPVCITTQSPYQWNYWPVLRRDSAKVVFNAGPTSFPSEAICEVNLDGSGFHVRITKNDGPPGYGPSPAVHSPSVAPNGDLIFEAEWGGGERTLSSTPEPCIDER